jgi:hypothetical protein
MHRGGGGDARASCASPLGTPLGATVLVLINIVLRTVILTAAIFKAITLGSLLLSLLSPWKLHRSVVDEDRVVYHLCRPPNVLLLA